MRHRLPPLPPFERLTNEIDYHCVVFRLSAILQKKSLVPKKLDEIKIKANILSAFVEKKAAEHDKAEL